VPFSHEPLYELRIFRTSHTLTQVLGKLASNCRTHDDRERMVFSGVPRLVVRLLGWARDHNDEAVMLQVACGARAPSVSRCAVGMGLSWLRRGGPRVFRPHKPVSARKVSSTQTQCVPTWADCSLLR
jgi:hypothetical protein